MAYVDVPLVNQKIKDTQPLIRQNFIEISALVNVDHFTFGSPNAGRHRKVTMPDIGPASPAFPGNALGLFAKTPTVSPLTGVNELFIRKQDGTEIPFSASGQTQTGWTYLPSGILLKWGLANSTGLSNPIVYPTGAGIPAFTTIFSVQVTAVSAVMRIAQLAIGTTTLGFNIETYDIDGNGRASAFYYFAVGN